MVGETGWIDADLRPSEGENVEPGIVWGHDVVALYARTAVSGRRAPHHRRRYIGWIDATAPPGQSAELTRASTSATAQRRDG